MQSSLQYLIFDLLDTDETSRTWEAMASVAPERVSEVLAEATDLLVWAGEQFGTDALALDDGGEWDAWVQVQADQAEPRTLDWHKLAKTPVQTFPPGTRWVTIALTLTASEHLADAMQQHLDTVNPA